MEIIERMFSIMEDKKIKSSVLAERLNIQKSTISTWKKRKNNPPMEYAETIAELLEVSIEYLLTGKEKEYTAEEQEIIRAYRQQDEGTRRAVCKILDVERDEQERSSTSRTG